jgi:hypothetical protein
MVGGGGGDGTMDGGVKGVGDEGDTGTAEVEEFADAVGFGGEEDVVEG